MKSAIRSVYTFARLWVFGLLCAVSSVDAATYYVATTGSNSNPGTQAAPWLTIGKAASVAQGNDTVYVEAGNYPERVAINNGGTAGNFVNYVAQGTVICRGFDLTSVSYVRVIGFEVTQTNTANLRGIVINGISSHIEILDNYIHDVIVGGIVARVDSTTSFITVRGNNLYYMGHVPGNNDGTTEAIGNNFVTSDHWLIEYNSAQRSGDFIDVYGTNILVRNNYLHDFQNSYWTNIPDSLHSDMFQPGSDLVVAGTRNQIYERNFCGDSTEVNSHFGLFQDTTSSGDTNIMLRGNVGYNFGSVAIGVISTDHVVSYGNTFYQMCTKVPTGNALLWYKKSTSSDYPLNGLGADTIIAENGNYTADAIYVLAGATTTLTHNLGYLAGSDSSYVSTQDPLFVDPINHNFRLQAGSPAIAAGINVVWITSNSGSGTSFNVNDPQLLCDGWGMVDGDTVTIGGVTTHVTSITANSVTVADSVTWTKNMAVYWGKYSVVDIGALPYGSKALTSARLYQSANTYTVGTTGDARGVWFYVDGIPTIWVSTPPFTATITNGIVTAKAYALYAQANPVVVAINTHSTLPTPPTGLTVTNVP